MARPVRCRRIGQLPEYRSISPDDIDASGIVRMTLDEFETIRLIDNAGMTQEEGALQMNVARTTFTAIYKSARRKVADVLISGKRLLIAGGSCECIPVEAPSGLTTKGSAEMRIAIAYDNGEIFRHFGHTECFKLYDVEEGRITHEQIVDTDGSGHGALAGFLKAVESDVLICGGIGQGAQLALEEAGIRLYGGVQGSADEAVRAFVSGELKYDPEVKCDHHGHHEHQGGDCGHGNCGEHHSHDK